MPELPDLELFSRNLTNIFAGDTVSDVEVFKHNKVHPSAVGLHNAIVGQSLTRVFREGKELWFQFSNDRVLAIHLMLRGKFIHTDTPVEKAAIIALEFEASGCLVLVDPLGWANVTLDPPKPAAPDALDVDLQYLQERLSQEKSRRTIKSFLLDQKILRGIGNAYADEILWDARISPESLCGKIPDEAVQALFVSIKRVLNNAVEELKRATPDAISGEYREFLAVHNKSRSVTPTGAEIKIKKVAGKKTYYTNEQILYV